MIITQPLEITTPEGKATGRWRLVEMSDEQDGAEPLCECGGPASLNPATCGHESPEAARACPVAAAAARRGVGFGGRLTTDADRALVGKELLSSTPASDDPDARVDAYGPLREDHLAAIKARVAKATPGPWTYEVNDRASTGSAHFAVKTAYAHPKHPHSPRYITFMCGGLGESRYLRHPKPEDYREDPDTKVDTDFIAHAREDVPALVAEVERLRTLVRALGGTP